MKKRIGRQVELTVEEVKAAVCLWFKTVPGMKVPDDETEITFRLTAKGAVVAWTEEGEEA